MVWFDLDREGRRHWRKNELGFRSGYGCIRERGVKSRIRKENQQRRADIIEVIQTSFYKSFMQISS